jgi:Fic/DOC family N-terminal
MLSNPQLLIDPFLRREAVLSSRIEGTQAEQILRPAGNTPSGRLYIAGKILQVAESE